MADDRQLTPMSLQPAPPDDDDIGADDQEFDPALEPKKAKAWLNRLKESEDAFEPYNEHCDKIDERYASLKRLANMARDKEFQMFWANAEVLKPSIYAKPPLPVVVPKFLDRRPVYQAAAEMLERCAVVAFDLAGIDELMKLVRDDLALIDRGVAWCRYVSAKGNEPEKVAIDFKNRRDFLHSISRNWREVSWVAGASYLTRGEARRRFKKRSGDEYQRAEYRVDKEAKAVGGADERERGKFWEIWDRTNKRVVWVAEGCENLLDEDDPELKLRNFFPCPKPAYGTTQRGSLVPVPDVMQYKDQLEELNLLTGRIHALSDALEAKGFYPAGGSELGDAVQQAINIKTPGRLLVPISNWAVFGGSKEVIIWLPIDMIAQTVTGLVQLRQQIIQDIYQIMGLSDIMRGATSPEETLGAQQLKSEYGSVRIRDKQQEIVRLARDLVEIATEIITDKFADDTIVEMSQTTLPTNAMVKQQIDGIVGQLRQQQQMMQQQLMHQPQPPMGGPPQPGMPQPMGGPPQPNPQAAMQAQVQQMMQQGAAAITKLQSQPTVDQVLHFLKDNRAKAFTLDIETDSTIVPNEQQEKQQRTEFVGMLAQLMPQLAQMIQADPKTADFCGEILKFSVAPFRAGRSLDGAIDDLVQQMKAKGDQPQGDDPTTAQNKTALQIEQMKVEGQKQIAQGEQTLKTQQLEMQDRHKQAELENQRTLKQMELNARGGDQQAEQQRTNLELMQSREEHQADMAEGAQNMQLAREKADQQAQAAQQKTQQAAQMHEQRRSQMQFKLVNTPQGPVQ